MEVDTAQAAAIGGLVVGVIALVFAAILAWRIHNAGTGTEFMREIASAIAQGAAAFLGRELKTVAIFVVCAAGVIGGVTLSWETVVCFLVGATLSATSGYIGMSISVRSNVRTAAAAQVSLNKALRVAFNSGTVMSMCVVGFGIVGLSALFLIFGNFNVLAGFGFGASSIALFARVAGGIYTKGADVGADLVGKVESDLPEDDPRNPGVIADLVGDNVGDVAGMGADLYESYVGSIIAAATLGTFAASGDADQEKLFVAVPLWIGAAGIVSSIFGSFAVRTKEGATQNNLLWAMRGGVFVASLLIMAFAAVGTAVLQTGWNLFLCVVLGLVCGILIGFSTEYATSFAFFPTQSIARQGVTGPATVIIQGLGIGMLSALPAVILICATIIGCALLSGVYGVAVSAVGMLSTLGVTLATDAYGPVADNAGGIAEMAGLPGEIRDRTDALDSLGNTTAATGKGFAIGSAVLTALALMTAYTKAVQLDTVDLVSDILTIPGLIFGTMLPFVFASLAMLAVGNCAKSIIEEVRRQFREIVGLREGEEGVRADYETCVAITTKAALQEMVLPGALAVVIPIVVGLCLGPRTLAGLLMGAIASGFMLAVTMANSGGAWDNAKKWVEAGHLDGKGSDIHKACVVGDTVGDPFKDTSGPSLNILIKLMSIVSLVLAPMFKKEVQQSVWWVGLIVLVVALVAMAWWARHVHEERIKRTRTARDEELHPVQATGEEKKVMESRLDRMEDTLSSLSNKVDRLLGEAPAPDAAAATVEDSSSAVAEVTI